MFFRTEPFGFAERLQEACAEIRGEFLENFDPRDARPWPQRFVYTKEWTLLPLVDLGRMAQHGVAGIDEDLQRNKSRFPRTVEVVTGLRGLTTAGFSRLAAGTRIHPHRGIDHTVLRCHLGVITPPGCMLHVNGVVREWSEGCVWLFDDCYSHEVWSGSDQSRVVLIMDFNKKDLEKITGRPVEEFAIPRTAEEIARGEDLDRRMEEWQKKYAAEEPQPDWDRIFGFEIEEP
jgi:aspartyl/asparaginyl beta-hydroxylase